MTLRFDGRVAIITGGAAVVVADIGADCRLTSAWRRVQIALLVHDAGDA